MIEFGPQEPNINHRKFDLVVAPLNGKGIPLFYEYIIHGHVDTNNNTTVTLIQILNNLASLSRQGFEPHPIGIIGPSGESLVR